MTLSFFEKINNALDTRLEKIFKKWFDKFIEIRRSLSWSKYPDFEKRTQEIEDSYKDLTLLGPLDKSKLLRSLLRETTEYGDKKVMETYNYCKRYCPDLISNELEREVKKIEKKGFN
ncbi:MAG: hypothetical protein WCQ65_10665 [Fermentimonas sp.]